MSSWEALGVGAAENPREDALQLRAAAQQSYPAVLIHSPIVPSV